MNQIEQAIVDKAEDILRKEMAPEVRELLGSGYVPDYYINIARVFVTIALGEVRVAVKAALSALSEPVGEAEPVAWIYEDQLPDGYPYHIMFPYSEVRDGVRMFPVYAPLSADRIMEVVEKAREDHDNIEWRSPPESHNAEFRKLLRFRLSSELGLK